MNISPVKLEATCGLVCLKISTTLGVRKPFPHTIRSTFQKGRTTTAESLNRAISIAIPLKAGGETP